MVGYPGHCVQGKWSELTPGAEVGGGVRGGSQGLAMRGPESHLSSFYCNLSIGGTTRRIYARG